MSKIGIRVIVALTVVCLVILVGMANGVLQKDESYANVLEGHHHIILVSGTKVRLLRVNDDLTTSPCPAVVLRLDDDPAPPINPDPTKLTERGKEICKAADAITGDPNREQSALKLAVLHKELAKTVTANNLGRQATALAIKLGYDGVIPQKVRDKWKGVREKLSEQLTAVLREHGEEASEEYAKLLRETGDGLACSGKSSPESLEARAEDLGVDLATIIKLIAAIMEIIKSLINENKLP